MVTTLEFGRSDEDERRIFRRWGAGLVAGFLAVSAASTVWPYGLMDPRPSAQDRARRAAVQQIMTDLDKGQPVSYAITRFPGRSGCVVNPVVSMVDGRAYLASLAAIPSHGELVPAVTVEGTLEASQLSKTDFGRAVLTASHRQQLYAVRQEIPIEQTTTYEAVGAAVGEPCR